VDIVALHFCAVVPVFYRVRAQSHAVPSVWASKLQSSVNFYSSVTIQKRKYTKYKLKTRLKFKAVSRQQRQETQQKKANCYTGATDTCDY